MKKYQIILRAAWALAILSFSLFNMTAQGWEQTYSLSTGQPFGHVVARADGGFTAMAYNPNFGWPNPTAKLLATDEAGSQIWDSSPSMFFAGQLLLQAPGGGYYIIGSEIVDFAAYSRLGLTRTDQTGQPLWEMAYLIDGSYFYQGPLSGLVLPTEDVLIAGTLSGSGANEKSFLLKTDSDGNQIWAKDFEQVDYRDSFQTIALADNGDYLLAGSRFWTSQPSQGLQLMLTRTDTDGNILSTVTWNEINTTAVATQLDDGNLLFAANDSVNLINSPLLLNKTDQDGNLLWEKTIPAKQLGFSGNYQPYPIDMTATADGGAVLIYRESFISSIVKLDAAGEVEWFKILGTGALDQVELFDVKQAPNGGYILAGWRHSSSTSGAYLLHLGANGLLYENIISGKVYSDDDGNCDYDSSENNVEDWIVKFESAGATYYATSDADGNYSVDVPPSTFEVSLVAHPYFEICPASSQVIFSANGETATVDFGLQDTVQCPLLEVSLEGGSMRRCFENKYDGIVCNTGTTAAENAYFEVLLDPWLNFLSALPVAPTQDGQLLTFDMGTLEPGECFGFQITFELDCDVPQDITHCTEIHAYPDSLCLPDDPEWDGSSIVVSGECVDDETIHFTILNDGNGNMEQAAEFIVIEDNMIMYQGNFQLNADEEMPSDWTATGSTFRLEAEQCPGHPGSSFPNVTVEGCGIGQGLVISTGFYTQYPQDDANPWIDIVCQVNTAAFDPNDKTGFPHGVFEEHFIKPQTDLEYLVRFQNTGTDTAFNVVIRDTLSLFLDPGSVRPGASSHPYEFELIGLGVAKFTFPNIMLPDSNVNEELSHGFVSFRISQQPDVPLGSAIENSAAIYFDFNEPVFTNQTWHTVEEDFLIVNSLTAGPEGHLPKVKVYPNPFLETAFFEVEGIENEKVMLKIFDQTGRLVHSVSSISLPLKLPRGELPAGLYFFEMRTEKILLGSGKVFVAR